MDKNLFIKEEEIVQLLQAEMGDCLASDQIMVDGFPIGYIYREEPYTDYDSGWRFLSGYETPDYMDDTDNHGIYDLNILCNYDQDIIPLLDSPPGSSFARDASGRFSSLVEDKKQDYQVIVHSEYESPPPEKPPQPFDRQGIIRHIERYFGEPSFLMQNDQDNFNLEIIVIEPNHYRDYYALFTIGMSAHDMLIPDNIDHISPKAELFICLPADWGRKRTTNTEMMNPDFWGWPVNWLGKLARFPYKNKTWLGYGHSLSNGLEAKPFASDTKYCGFILDQPDHFGKEFYQLRHRNGMPTQFYYLLPVYKEELDFKLKFGAEKALNQIFKSHPSPVISQKRKNCFKFKRY